MVPNSDPRNIETGSVILRALCRPALYRAHRRRRLALLPDQRLGHEGRTGPARYHPAQQRLRAHLGAPLPVEPDDERENSYAVLLAAPSGALYLLQPQYRQHALPSPTTRRSRACAAVAGSTAWAITCSNTATTAGVPGPASVIPSRCARRPSTAPTPTAAGRYFWNVGKPFILGGAWRQPAQGRRPGRVLYLERGRAAAPGPLTVSDRPRRPGRPCLR